MKNIIFIFIVFFTVSTAFASEQEGKSLFQRMCDKCHTLERALSKNKDLKEWKRITIENVQ